jgi:hypothetical protein
MSMSIRQRGATVAGVLAADATLHLFWATGATWPAHDVPSLSRGLLGAEVSFAPPLLISLATVLLSAATMVVLRSTLGRRHRLGGLLQLATIGLTVGLLARAIAGVVWALGIGADADTTFYWLNLLVYTPLCVALGFLAATVARDGTRRGASTPATGRRTAETLSR